MGRNQKIEILLQLKHGFSNTVPSAESLRSKISLEEKEETINLRLDTPPQEEKSSGQAVENLHARAVLTFASLLPCRGDKVQIIICPSVSSQ